jgi:hypothetical protein
MIIRGPGQVRVSLSSGNFLREFCTGCTHYDLHSSAVEALYRSVIR